MSQKRRPILMIMIFTCLLFVGLTSTVRSQEKSGADLNPEPGKAAKPKMLSKRPPRYPTALAGLEVIADLSVSPPAHTGQCPAVFTFKGKITVNRPAMVQYRFVRSDNTRHALGVLNFEEAGSKEVTDEWVFDDPAQLPNFKGWEAIQINLPMKLMSNLSYFDGTCTEYKGGAPEPRKVQEPSGAVGPRSAPGTKAPQSAPRSMDWPQPDPLLPPVKR